MKKLDKLAEIRHMWDHYSREGYANYVKNQYLFVKTVRPKTTSAHIYSLYLRSLPNDTQLRELARNDPWITMYEMGTKLKDGDIQRRLYSYTRMYQSIRESDLDDAIIDDDYALDGWLILNKRNKEKEKFKNEIDKKVKSKGQHVMVPVSPDQAQKINDLNDAFAKAKKEKVLNANFQYRS